MDICDDLVNWKFKPFELKNASDWLEEDLKSIYENTTGPFESPDPVECWVLHYLAKSTTGNILEFGSWRGRSSCFLAHGILQSKLPDRKLVCIDWYKGDSTGGQDASKEAMEQALNRFQLANFVEIVDQDMLTIDYSSLVKNTDLVFYDSDHNTEPTTKVLEAIHPFLNDKAIIVFHDAGWPMTRAALLNIKPKYKYLTTLNVWQGLAIARRR